MPRCSGPSSLMVDGAGGLIFFLVLSAFGTTLSRLFYTVPQRVKAPAFNSTERSPRPDC